MMHLPCMCSTVLGSGAATEQAQATVQLNAPVCNNLTTYNILVSKPNRVIFNHRLLLCLSFVPAPQTPSTYRGAVR